EFAVTPQRIVGGDERKIDCNTFVDCWIGQALGDPVTVGCGGDLVANGGQVIRAVGMVYVGEECAALACQGHAAAQQVAGRAPRGWRACSGAPAFPRLGRGCTGTWCGRGERSHNKTGAVGWRNAWRSPPCALRGFATLSIPRWYAGEGASISIKAVEPTPNSL